MEEELKKGNRLTDAGARRIRELRAQNRTLQSIAVELKVSVGTVWNVTKGKTHCAPPPVPSAPQA